MLLRVETPSGAGAAVGVTENKIADLPLPMGQRPEM